MLLCMDVANTRDMLLAMAGLIRNYVYDTQRVNGGHQTPQASLFEGSAIEPAICMHVFC